MSDAIITIRQVNEFIVMNPDHPVVIEYNRGEVGLGYIIRHWKEIQDETDSDRR